MNNQETAIYDWDGVLKRWRVTLLVKEKPTFTGQFNSYIEAVQAIKRVHKGELRTILSTSPKKPHRGF